MNKLLLDIICPSTGKTYDFWVAKNLLVESALEKIAKEISNFESNPVLFKDIYSMLLYSPRGMLDKKISLKEAGVHSGDTLMLI